MIPETRALPLPIQWHEGMLLAPQHFQQMTMRNELLLQWRMMLASPYQWGVRRMAYDTALLLNGRLRIRALEALMPDGLVVAFTGEEGYELEVDLELYADDLRSGPVMIHLAVAASRSGANPANGDLGRYDSVESDPVHDTNTGDEPVRLPLLRPRLTLLVGEHPPSRYIAMPIAEISLRNGLYGVTEYIAPTLSVAADSPLGAICTEIVRTLRERAMYLAEDIRARRYDMGPSQVQEQLSKIQSMVEGLPQLEAMLNTGIAHPFPLYMSLCHVSGHVATLGEMRIPPIPPLYDHNNLRLTFLPLRDFIIDAVEQGVWEQYMSILFTLRNDVFHRRMDIAWLEGPSLLIGVRGAPRVSQREIVAWIDSCIIGSSPLMQSLRERRILGAGRRPYSGEDLALAARGMLLFEIDTNGDFILPDEDLLIANIENGSADVEEIVLFVRNERKSQETVR